MRKALAVRSKTVIAFGVIEYLAAVGVFGIAAAYSETNAFWILIAAGGAILFFAVLVTVRFARTPKIIIEREDDKLYFPNFSCMVWEIETVNCSRAWSKYVKTVYGVLKVTVGGKKHVYYDVENVEQVAYHLEKIAQNVRKNREGEANG